MTHSEPILTSSTHHTAVWPHAVIDCLSTAPCPSCYCYVCDVPIAQCDDPVAHAPADGARDAWNAIKRRRRALADTWADIPTLVNIIVSLSVEEAVRRADATPPTTQPPDVQLIAHAFDKVVTIKQDTLSVPADPQVDTVQVHTANAVKKECH